LDAFKKAMPAYASLKFSKVKKQKAPSLAAKIVEMEEMMTIKRTVKFGVLLCKGGQEDENKMFQNSMTPALEEFLDFMGTKIELAGWTGFAGGLDTSAECRTGKSTYYTEIDEFKLLFHVSTMLPYFPMDEQQLERKRHLGNDIVCVIFLEEDSHGSAEHFFDPSWLHTCFTHVFFVVSPDREMTKKTGVTHYRLAVACHSGTTPFGPRIPAPAVFPKGPELRSFFLTKLINSERAALTAPAFQARLHKVKEVRPFHSSLSAHAQSSTSLFSLIHRHTFPRCSNSCKYVRALTRSLSHRLFAHRRLVLVQFSRSKMLRFFASL
jgi:hypothetical protein